MCGAVRFQVTAPFTTAGYCHCTRCQRRTGTLSSLSGTVAAEALEILSGAEEIRTWRPPEGFPKSYCGLCGGHVFGGELDGGGAVVVRLGAVDGDPGIQPQWRQWIDSVPAWHPIPDDGLPRYGGPRPQR